MAEQLSRRTFAAAAAGVVIGTNHLLAQEKKDPPKVLTPTEAPFERDYPAPAFKPSWKKPQLNRQLVQDFVIYAHTDLNMVKKLVEKEPGLVLSSMNWGGDDWETALGAASHMGNREMAKFLLEKGARIDIFCAAMMGLVDVVKAFITLEPKLIDAKGPHGFTLHFHAQVGGPDSEKVLDYLQSVKKIDLKPNPFLKKDPPKKEPEKK